MKNIIRKEILIERTRTLTIRFNLAPVLKFCSGCRTDADFVSVNQAAALAQMTDRQIFRLIEENQLHHAESTEGFLLVCLHSLQNLRAAANPDQLNSGEKL